MHWGDYDLEYARPIRWILCLHGEQVIPFNLDYIKSGNISKGHPVLASGDIEIPHAAKYVELLKERKVLVDLKERAEMINEQLDQITAKNSATVPRREQVLKQVLNLVEYPFLQEVTFPETFLEIPKELLISEMVEHQKYFALLGEDNKLQNKFVITCNNEPNETIEGGNQKVLVARLSDGQFMYREDLKIPMQDRLEPLAAVTYLKGLGSLADKVQRIQKHTKVLFDYIKCNEKNALRTAELCKSDLVSQVVYDFPELQGIIGKYYAEAQGEEKEVGWGIEDHYKPAGMKDTLPREEAGLVVALADKIDNLLSCFGMGLIPSPSSDPFALRRQALGIIRIVIENKLNIPIFNVLEKCLAHFEGKLSRQQGEILTDLNAFIKKRIETVFVSYNLTADEIAASVQIEFSDIHDLYLRILALKSFRTHEAFPLLLEVYKRCSNLLAKNKEAHCIKEDLLQEESEKVLFEQLGRLDNELTKSIDQKDYQEAYNLLAKLQPSLDTLFDSQRGVKIMADDPALKANRLGLLFNITQFFNRLLDFSRITPPNK